MMFKIHEIAETLGLENGYRVVSNNGEDAFQTVKHLHFHILGGKTQLGIHHNEHHQVALDGDSQIALMLGADTGHPAGHDLAFFGLELGKSLSVLEVNVVDFGFAEAADLGFDLGAATHSGGFSLLHGN